MSALKPEYQAIIDECETTHDERLARCVIGRCQALADRPPLMLTDDEIEKASLPLNVVSYSYARAIEAAHIAKQSAPEVVPFNFQLWQQGGWAAIDERGNKALQLWTGINYTSMVRES